MEYRGVYNWLPCRHSLSVPYLASYASRVTIARHVSWRAQ